MSFIGSQLKCKACEKIVHPVELLLADGVPYYHKSCFKGTHCKGTLKVMVEGQSYYKSCFKCSHGGCPISPSNYAALEGILYCNITSPSCSKRTEVTLSYQVRID